MQAGELFSQYYEYDCYIDDVTKAEVQGVAQEQITTVRAHFIKNNEAIESAEIFSWVRTSVEYTTIQWNSQTRLSNNILLITGLRLALLEDGLNLQNVLDPPSGLDENSNELMKILLIAVSVISCLIMSALIAFFTIRERSIARQLKALSTTVYEPEAIATNQVRPPNTNVFADESIGRDLREAHKSKATEAAFGGGDDRPSLVFDNLRWELGCRVVRIMLIFFISFIVWYLVVPKVISWALKTIRHSYQEGMRRALTYA